MADDDQPDEQEKLDRRLDQLLGELRVAMPGVQVLFAFLLAVPFQQRFTTVTEFQKHVYFATLLASAAASALFIAPTAFHRLMFRERDKPHVIDVSSRLAVTGLGFLAIAMTGAVLLVTDLLFQEATVIITVILTAAMFIGLWFVLGILRRLGRERSH